MVIFPLTLTGKQTKLTNVAPLITLIYRRWTLKTEITFLKAFMAILLKVFPL